MAVTAQDIQELRRRTGAGIMDCKKALTEANGDMDKAIKLLREWGISKAAKKSGREATEGVLNAVLSADKKKGALIEVNCETDFVAKTDDFKVFAKNVAEEIFKKGYTDSSQFDSEITDQIKEGISKFGENIIVNSIKTIEARSGIFYYIHTDFKKGVMLAIDCDKSIEDPAIVQLGNDLAVHTTANTVVAISKEDIKPEIIEAKRNEYIEELKKQGKPDNIIAKVVEGKLAKFYKDETLLGQPFLKNEEITVGEYIQSVAKQTGAQIKVTGFIKTIIGE